MNLPRRRFLMASGLAAVPLACGSEARHVVDPARGSGPASGAVGAETILGVEYSAAERALMSGLLESQLDMVRMRRALRLPVELSPALVFDPRLPGTIGNAGPRQLVWQSRGELPLPSRAEDIAFASLGALGHWLRRRLLSSVALTEIYLGRLAAHGAALECVVTTTRDLALSQARAADAELDSGRVRGPLHGIPYGLKDLFDTKGIATTWGAAPYRDRVPKTDAEVVARLGVAGAVLVAKLSLGELASGEQWFGGRTRNPWNREEGSNGSSAGSAAAVAAGLVGFALGSETMGSIISPACRCGTSGFRPSFGRVPRTGAMPLCWSLDKIGAVTRAVEDSAMVMAAVHGQHHGDPGSRSVPFGFDAGRGLRGRRIGYRRQWFEGKEATAVDATVLDALRRLGAELVPVEMPDLPFEALLPILLAEAAAAFEELTESDRDDLLVGQTEKSWPNTFRAARFLSAVDLVQADRLRRLAMEATAKVFDDVDAVVSPPDTGLANPTNYTGHPALALRAGFVERRTRAGWRDSDESEQGRRHQVPRGAVLVGRLDDDGALLEIGHALERELGVWQTRPAL